MEFKRGSVLKRKIYGVFSHMGIYCNENQVYHFQKTGKKTSVVCTSLADFSNGRDVSVHLEPDNAKHACEIIERAEGALRNKKWDNNYSFLFLNCEDFCIFCHEKGRYGRLSQRGKSLLVAALVAVAIAVKRGLSKDRPL